MRRIPILRGAFAGPNQCPVSARPSGRIATPVTPVDLPIRGRTEGFFRLFRASPDLPLARLEVIDLVGFAVA